MARKSLLLCLNRLWSNLTQSGTPATAVRFGNRPAPSAGRHLTGQKGFRASPTHKAVGRDFFVASKQRFHLSPVCDSVGAVPKLSASSDAGQLFGRMVAADGPLRAEGFPKRRCQFEFIAAKPNLSPRKLDKISIKTPPMVSCPVAVFCNYS